MHKSRSFYNVCDNCLKNKILHVNFFGVFQRGGVIYLTISVLLHFLNKKVLLGRIRRRNSGFQSRFAVVDIRYRIADYNADDLRRESGVDVT